MCIGNTKTNVRMKNLRATSLAPLGDAFMYIEAGRKNSGDNNVLDCSERKDTIQINIVTLYHTRFSKPTSIFGLMGRYLIEIGIKKDN